MAFFFFEKVFKSNLLVFVPLSAHQLVYLFLAELCGRSKKFLFLVLFTLFRLVLLQNSIEGIFLNLFFAFQLCLLLILFNFVNVLQFYVQILQTIISLASFISPNILGLLLSSVIVLADILFISILFESWIIQMLKLLFYNSFFMNFFEFTFRCYMFLIAFQNFCPLLLVFCYILMYIFIVRLLNFIRNQLNS